MLCTLPFLSDNVYNCVIIHVLSENPVTHPNATSPVFSTLSRALFAVSSSSNRAKTVGPLPLIREFRAPASFKVFFIIDMTGYFDEIAGATVDGSREKKDDVIRYLLDKIGEDESDTVMVGDTNFDVLGAAELGIPCIAVTWGFGDIDEMKKAGAVAIVSSMDELYEAVR